MDQFKDVKPEHFDFVILGTGLAETAVSCVLSKNKDYKILHIDRNSSYGSEFATLQYRQVETYFDPNTTPIPDFLDKNREFNIDLTPKLLLQDSRMKDFLLENKIEDLVIFGSIKGSYIFSNKLHSIPTSEIEAFKSPVISYREKFKVAKFFWNIRNHFNDSNTKTEGSMMDEFKKFGLSKTSIDFIGHAIALNLNDDYLDNPPKETYNRIVQYISSIVSYENSKSPYIYPIYGLSELCQSFSRKSAVNGTLFMLKADIKKCDGDKIYLIDPNGEKHCYVGGKIIADPRYYPDSVITKEIIRCIMIIRKGSLGSRNIIFLKSHLNRKNDIFCVILGHEECACPEGLEIGIVSTLKETDDPHKELDVVLSNFDIIKYYLETRLIHENSDKKKVIFTKNVDESPLMDNIYDDIESILSKLQTDFDGQPLKQ